MQTVFQLSLLGRSPSLDLLTMDELSYYNSTLFAGNDRCCSNVNLTLLLVSLPKESIQIEKRLHRVQILLQTFPDNFQKVIGQSGSALAGWAFDNQPEKHAKEIALM